MRGSAIVVLGIAATSLACGAPSGSVPAASIVVAPDTASLTPGSTIQLAVVGSQPVTWSSSVPTVASVSGSGLVTAVDVGRTRVTATGPGVSGSATVTVTAVPVVELLVTPAAAVIALNHSVQLSALAIDANGAAVVGCPFTWATHAAPIAIVSSSGLLSAEGLGTAQIFVSCEGFTVVALVTVVEQ